MWHVTLACLLAVLAALAAPAPPAVLPAVVTVGSTPDPPAVLPAVVTVGSTPDPPAVLPAVVAVRSTPAPPAVLPAVVAPDPPDPPAVLPAVVAVGSQPLIAAGNHSDVHPDQTVVQDVLGVRLLGPIYVSEPVISPLMVTREDIPSKQRPSFSHVYSVFEAGQKGTDPRQPGSWFLHRTVTLVLSHHHGCPFKIYKMEDGEINTEVLGNPLENAEFRPTTVLWAGILQTVESLCQDMFSLVSYVSVTGWTTDGMEVWDAERMEAAFPHHSAELRRLAGAQFDADQSGFHPELYHGDWAPE